MDSYQQYIHKSRYARYLPEEKRRETWEESVERYCDFMNYMAIERGGTPLSKEIKQFFISCSPPDFAISYGYNCICFVKIL